MFDRERYTSLLAFLSPAAVLASSPHQGTSRRAACHTTIDSLAFGQRTLSRGEPLGFAAARERRWRMTRRGVPPRSPLHVGGSEALQLLRPDGEQSMDVRPQHDRIIV